VQQANTRRRLQVHAPAAVRATIKPPPANRRARRVRRCVNNCAQSTPYRRVQSTNFEGLISCLYIIDVLCSHSDVCICALLTSTHLVSLRSGYLLGCGCHCLHELCREFIFSVERPVELLGMLGRQLSRHHRAILVLDVCSGTYFLYSCARLTPYRWSQSNT
jgi:hypothetical protein